jgi:hypothetical protein
MYIFADWFPAELLSGAAAQGASGVERVAAEKGRAGSRVPGAAQAVVNASRTLNLVLDILFVEFRDVYTAIEARLKQEREKVYAVPV